MKILKKDNIINDTQEKKDGVFTTINNQDEQSNDYNID